MKKILVLIQILLAASVLYAVNDISLMDKSKESGITYYWDSLAETGMLEKNGHQITFRKNEQIVILDSVRMSVTDAPELKNNKIDTYKIVNKDDIVFNCNIKLTQTTTKFAVAQYKDNKPCIVSNFYVVMHCDSSHLLPEYLMLWLVRDEFARYVRFISCSSVRDSFGFEDMQNVSIPIPSIEIQQALIKVFNCALEAKRIAGEADKLSRDICPPLMQKVINC